MITFNELGIAAAARAIAADTPAGQMHRASEIAEKAVRAYLDAIPGAADAPQAASKPRFDDAATLRDRLAMAALPEMIRQTYAATELADAPGVNLHVIAVGGAYAIAEVAMQIRDKAPDYLPEITAQAIANIVGGRK